MIRYLFTIYCLFLSVICFSSTTVVKNMDELNAANAKAQPGDTIILQNGEWQHVTIKLDCKGTEALPILFKAQTPGKVIITGNSRLKLGGNYIIVDGLFFTKGYAGNDAVITYRINNDKLANHCEVRNCAIEDFNNPKRMDENYWVAFYGKNNRLEHCSFRDKKNMGVLLAVILDDDRSRENNHVIEHNYFGRRTPLASNGGEIIRVGVSQHCQFNSNTHIGYNLFEHCDGETEIISIKSCQNEVEGNVFKECQGAVVLRHGDNNLVAGNYFIGNDKPGTGGVRVINKGQAVVSNIFYKCRGVDFRSPLAIMNGIPNSPAHRYVQVINAEISNNTFYECSPLAFCEGSDTERTLPPDGVRFFYNTFYNTRDSIIYRVSDDMKGFTFLTNAVSKNVIQSLPDGFSKQNVSAINTHRKGPDHPHVDNILSAEKEARAASGAKWFTQTTAAVSKKQAAVNCPNAATVYAQLEKKVPVLIQLTGKDYTLDKPFVIVSAVQFTTPTKSAISFHTGNIQSVFLVAGNGNLSLKGLNIDGTSVKATHFISSDSSGSSAHYNLSVVNCSIRNLSRENGCGNFFYAYKSIIADSIILSGNLFTNNPVNLLIMNEEKDDKGYYNAEKIVVRHNSLNNQQGILLNIYRGGNDESTLGPNLGFSHNKIINCHTTDNGPLLMLTGVQVTNIFSNTFTHSNSNYTLVKYKDVVRARHSFERNSLQGSGILEKDAFVTEKGNTIK